MRTAMGCVLVMASTWAPRRATQGSGALLRAYRLRALPSCLPIASQMAWSRKQQRCSASSIMCSAPPQSQQTDAVPSNLDVSPPTAQDVEVLQRQLGHKLSSVHAVSPPCRHGFPQAFVWDPLTRHREGKARRVLLDSGLFRLSCPLLVKAIDEWEGEGAVADLNEQVRADATGQLHADLVAGNLGHAAARRETFGERVTTLLNGPLPEETASSTRMILNSGIAGQTPAKADVKCLHAQAADFLCRSGSNKIGSRIMESLEERGVDVRGNADCCAQCNPAIPPGEAAWWYTPRKNRWRLRQKLMRRRAKRQSNSGEESVL